MRAHVSDAKPKHAGGGGVATAARRPAKPAMAPESLATLPRGPRVPHDFSAVRAHGGAPRLMRQCSACDDEQKLRAKSAGDGAAPASAPPIVHEVLASPGRALDAGKRSFFESRFRHDFSGVRLYTDARAARSADAVGAVAYTVGRSIVLGSGAHASGTATGDRLLAHELAHVVQQRGASAARTDDLPIGASDDPLEREADRAAATALDATSTTAPRAPTSSAPRVSRLTPAQFQAQLGSTPEQKLAIDTLFKDATFSALWSYMAACKATPAQDLGPLALDVAPGLKIGGTERFGGFFGGPRELKINPTKPEHVRNPAELVDTIVHELIHAVDKLESDCKAAGSGPAPLAGAATVRGDSSRANAIARGDEAQLNKDRGPGASDPCGEFIDINAAAQSTITSVLESNLKTTQVGHPTITFVNTIIRTNPAAMTEYEACRKPACAIAGKAARDAAVATCSRNVIGKFMPASSQAALVPTRVQFDFAKSALRADATEKLALVAIFLKEHAGVKVKLVGHADAVGAAGANMALGQARADAVRAFLVGEGVPAAQIVSTTSVGMGAPLATKASEQWMDRSVEIVP